MSENWDLLYEIADRTGQPVSDVVRHHLLESILRRFPASGEPILVLRGSMLTRLWAAPFPRVANDLDYLGMFPHSVSEAAERFLPALQTDLLDEVQFDLRHSSATGIWEDTEFPGVRFTLTANVLGEEQATTVDVGFGDPLVPSAEIVSYELMTGNFVPVWAVHPATLIGWKLHGLAERGEMRWQPKDILDLWLLTQRFSLPNNTLADAIRAAFVSRGYMVAEAQRTLESSYWESFDAEIRWEDFRQKSQQLSIPERITSIIAFLRDSLHPAIELL